MLPVLNSFRSNRIFSIDAFRGLTFLIMIFVNEVHHVAGIPSWMKHTLRDTDGMNFPDIVFPAFLFIVGMSIPFGINSRIQKGCSFFGLQWHVVYRSLALIVMGVFMVNAEDGFNEKAMGLSINVWNLLFYAAILLTWGAYRFERAVINKALRALGMLIIFCLALVYRSGADSSGWMTTQWWGILGLIGWAYLFASIFYQLSKGRVVFLVGMVALCTAYYVLSHIPEFKDHPLLGRVYYQDLHAAHTSIALCGVICSLIFFDAERSDSDHRRLTEIALFSASLVVAGHFFRPAYKISKIYATPAWCFYTASICIAIFSLLYVVIDVRKSVRWARLVEPAASNPLVIYFIPFVLGSLMAVFGLEFPAVTAQGVIGILFAASFAATTVYLMFWINRCNIKLKL